MGGIVSIMVNLMMVAYVSLLMKRMLCYEDDDISSSINQLSFDTFEEVKYTELSRSMAFYMSKNGN